MKITKEQLIERYAKEGFYGRVVSRKGFESLLEDFAQELSQIPDQEEKEQEELERCGTCPLDDGYGNIANCSKCGGDGWKKKEPTSPQLPEKLTKEYDNDGDLSRAINALIDYLAKQENK